LSDIFKTFFSTIMLSIPIYQADAFTDRLFGGNSAAICIFDQWPDDSLMQSVASENNLAETAFVVPSDGYFGIRWFTPAVEVDLCGHATLASALVLYECLGYEKENIVFQSPRSGRLEVKRADGLLTLDFPTDTLTPCDRADSVHQCTGIRPVATWMGKTDLIAMFESEEQISTMQPRLEEIARLPHRGLIVTSAGSSADFVSRFFAPQSGIDEDPVTGSAHTSLTPLWHSRLNKKSMTALQLSPRGGKLLCTYQGDRCLIGGKARLYMSGTIYIDTNV
jgi:PhzF family phenazine biosynthesis protein